MASNVSPSPLWRSRREVAQHYFPSACDHTAVDHLRRWILGDPQLRSDLERAGYRKGIRHFSPKMMTALRRNLGA